ncbi:sugar ABC transporter permease [Acidisoma cellulosilytica]|uniref:Sugar ABC transporter permease n=1 Tax=Acidisoma cellulosilyticum TaxID=2802395 RepID=A0A964E518_9PROT|nr:sugar ABC transporter permease [Acidisoma cellulosilyticum]MCB8882076.1 sugar ABC transporter permease [Acidisoma cellulosilyticum]
MTEATVMPLKPAPSRRSGPRRLDRPRLKLASLFLLAPAGILLPALFILPVCYAIYLGFTNLQLVGLHSVHYRFTGWANIAFMLSDASFYQSLWVTALFVVGSGAVGSTLLGLVLAIALQQAMPALRMAVSGLAILAWTLPPTTIALVWIASASPSGPIAAMMADMKADPLYDHALLIVSAANAWSLAGLAMIMFSAALRNVPKDMIEAGTLEGASSVQRMMRITLPFLKPTIVTSALLMTLLTFGNFTLIYLMTAGGPDNATNILPVYSYLEGFKFFNLGYSALLGNIIVIFSALLGSVFVFLGQSRR